MTRDTMFKLCLFSLLIWLGIASIVEINARSAVNHLSEHQGNAVALHVPRDSPGSESNVTQDEISAAREIVASAIVQMRMINKKRVENPLRNNYVLRTPGPSRSRRDDFPSLAISTEVANAAALITTVDFKAAAENGTSHFDYAQFDALRHRGSSPDTKRATSSFWMEDPSINRTGRQPFGGDQSYTVSHR